MRFSISMYTRTCEVCSHRPFRIIKLHNASLKILEEKLFRAALDVVKVLNKKAPNGRVRDKSRRLACALSGLIAEKLTSDILSFVAKHLEIESLNIQVNSENINIEEFEYETHNDIKIEFPDRTITLEVRSSMAYHPNLNRILNEYFSIIGPYVTSYKSIEYPKDYYILVLFHYPYVKKPNIEKFRKGIASEKVQVYFVGGASKEDMAKFGEDISRKVRQGSAKYRGITPVTRGRDAIEIISSIFEVEESKVEEFFTKPSNKTC